MREFYLISCLLLGSSAVFATVSIINYDYKYSNEVPEDLSFASSVDWHEGGIEKSYRDVDVIYQREAFSEYRGKKKAVTIVKTPQQDTEYSFELRGINVIGEKKVALVSAKAVKNKAKRSNGRKPIVRASQDSDVHLVSIGEEIADTGYTLKEIAGNQILITDIQGELMSPVSFSLISEASLKRAEIAYKNQLKKNTNKAVPSSAVKGKTIKPTTRKDK